MKALYIRESISFQRGLEPKEALDLGEYRVRHISKYEQFMDLEPGYYIFYNNGINLYRYSIIGVNKEEPRFVLNSRTAVSEEKIIDIWWDSGVSSYGFTLDDLIDMSMLYNGGCWVKKIHNDKIPPDYRKGLQKTNEGLSFKRGLDPKKALDVGKTHLDKVKFDSIPNELLEGWFRNNYRRGHICDFDENEGYLKIYNIPISANLSDPLPDLYLKEKISIDELIQELIDFDGDFVYNYNPETYKWTPKWK